jgi:hypothetical protein
MCEGKLLGKAEALKLAKGKRNRGKIEVRQQPAKGRKWVYEGQYAPP